MKSIEATEHQIQCAIVEWANLTLLPNSLSKIGDYLFAIPNGGNRSISEAVRLRKEGVKKGVSDLFLAFPIYRSGYYADFYSKCGLWIEVKSKKGRLSAAQTKWFILMNLIGYESVTVYSIDEGIEAIKDYVGIKK